MGTASTGTMYFSKTPKCQWKDELFYNRFETSCDNKYIYASDYDQNEDFTYCPYCGKEIEEIKS
jgi:hypothetical protein